MSLPAIMNNNNPKISWSRLGIKLKPKSISVLNFNAHSFASKFQEFVAYLQHLKSKITFIIITESWLHGDSDVALDIPGYKSYSLYRDRTGGGIKIYYLDFISSHIMSDFSSCSNDYECLFLKNFIPGFGNLVLGGIYRPPDGDSENFLQFITNVLEDVNGSQSLLVGDFNYNVLNPNNRRVNDYSNLLTSYGYINEVNSPTFVCKNPAFCIENWVCPLFFHHCIVFFKSNFLSS